MCMRGSEEGRGKRAATAAPRLRPILLPHRYYWIKSRCGERQGASQAIYPRNAPSDDRRRKVSYSTQQNGSHLCRILDKNPLRRSHCSYEEERTIYDHEVSLRADATPYSSRKIAKILPEQAVWELPKDGGETQAGTPAPERRRDHSYLQRRISWPCQLLRAHLPCEIPLSQVGTCLDKQLVQNAGSKTQEECQQDCKTTENR